jgi:hypothetical protein
MSGGTRSGSGYSSITTIVAVNIDPYQFNRNHYPSLARAVDHASAVVASVVGASPALGSPAVA